MRVLLALKSGPADDFCLFLMNKRKVRTKTMPVRKQTRVAEKNEHIQFKHHYIYDPAKRKSIISVVELGYNLSLFLPYNAFSKAIL